MLGLFRRHVEFSQSDFRPGSDLRRARREERIHEGRKLKAAESFLRFLLIGVPLDILGVSIHQYDTRRLSTLRDKVSANP